MKDAIFGVFATGVLWDVDPGGAEVSQGVAGRRLSRRKNKRPDKWYVPAAVVYGMSKLMP